MDMFVEQKVTYYQAGIWIKSLWVSEKGQTATNLEWKYNGSNEDVRSGWKICKENCEKC
jgi:hypothetical protein